MAWVIDTAHSAVEFSVKHMMISTVRGRFTKFSGTVVLDEANPANTTIEGAIELASVDTHDANRDAHLRSPDFFDAAQFPAMTFRSTRIEPAGSDQYKVTGDLTIKGVTRPMTLTVVSEGRNKDPWGNQRWGFSAEASINRKDWGLNWNVALEAGGWLVGEQVRITLEAELMQVQPQPQAAVV
jgi:polyisoprenoid-binding protein YceI